MADVENATIIAASLQDEELRNAVQTLVTTVEAQTNKMAESFTSAVNTMAASMNSLIESQKSYTQHVERESKTRISSYDKEAEAAKNALRIFPSNVSPTTLYTINPQKDIAPQVQAMVEREQELLKQKEAEAAVTREIAEEEKRVATLVEQSAERERARIQTEEHYLQQKRNSKKESDAELKTTEQLEERLRNLKRRYAELGSSKRYGDTGKELLSNIHEVEWAIRRIKTQEGRRMNISEVLGIDVKTLDDVAYKIQQLQAYKKGINFTDPKQASEIRMVNSELDRLTKIQDTYMSKGQRMTGLNKALARSWNYMKNRLAFMLTFTGVGNFVKQLIDIRGQYELLERSIGILIDNSQRGTAIFKELNDMAIKSPFTTMELGAAAKQLVAFNVGAEDVVDTTRRLADMAAAVGVPIDRLTYALGQVKAYGYLNSRDARIFLNAGIPIVNMLKDYYNAQKDVNEEMVTATQVRDMMTKRLISFEDVMAVVNKATDEGGRFFNFQEKAADTLRIRIANLTLAYNNMLNDIGKNQQGLLSASLKVLTSIMKNWRTYERILLSAIGVILTYRISMARANAVQQETFGMRAINAIRNYCAALKAAVFQQKALSAVMSVKQLAAFRSMLVGIGLLLWTTISNSMREAKQRVKEVQDAFNNLQTEFTSIYAKGISSDAFDDQLKELKNLIDKAKDELSITIPINLEDVNESNIQEKLREAREAIDRVLATATLFGESFAKDKGTKKALEGYETDFNRFKNIVSSNQMFIIDLLDRTGEKAGLARDDIQAMISEFGKMKDMTEPEFLMFFEKFISLYDSYIQSRNTSYYGYERYIQNDNLVNDREGDIIMSMYGAWEKYGVAAGKARKEANAFLDDFMRKVDMTTMDVETLSSAIEQNAKQAGLSAATIDLIFDELENRGINLRIGIANSVDDVINELQPWQQKLQDWADKNSVKLTVQFKTDQSEEEYAKSAGEAAKSAKETLDRVKQQQKQGLKTSSDVLDATAKYNNAVKAATAAGADLSSLFRSSGAKKDPLGDAMSKEIQYITDLQKLFKDYRSYGMDTQTALTEATNEFTKSLEKQHKELEKYGVKGVSGETLATMDMRGIRDMYQGWLDEAKVQKSAKAVEALEKAIKNLNNEINKEDYKKKTDSLNNALSKLSQEYELGVEISADSDLADAYKDIFGIDPSTITDDIKSYATKVTDLLNKNYKEKGVELPNLYDISDADLEKLKSLSVGLTSKLTDAEYEFIKGWVDKLRKLRKDYAKDLITQTKELEYELADANGKIAIEQKKLTQYKAKRDMAAPDSAQFKKYDLLVKKQEEIIARLGDEVVELLPTYQNLFNSIVEHSDFVTRKLTEQWGDALKKAVKSSDGRHYTITDPISNQTTTVNAKKYGQLLNQFASQSRKVQNNFEKIKEALTKGDDKIVDWVEGIKLITQEVATIGEGLHTVADIMEELGASEGVTEVMNDVATTMEGIGQMGQGVAELATNPIAGAIHILQGAWKAISTWLDNKNNEITRQIEEQERRIKALQSAYEELEYAAGKAMGAAEIEARRLAIANKEAQLAATQYNLALEQRKEYKKEADKKEQQDKISEYKDEIAEMKREIQDLKEGIVDELLGEDMKSAAESFVDAWVDAWKAGETTLDAMNEKMDEMVQNLIKKAVTSAMIERPLKEMYNKINEYTDKGSEGGYSITKDEMYNIAQMSTEKAKEINTILGEYYGMLAQLGISFGTSDKNLSALQQGIQGITEDTAGALEAITNNMAQQMYVQSGLLTEIRDAVVSIEGGEGMGIQAQMLFQLQQSYMVQMSIQNVLNGWSSPDGLSVRVDMI